MDKSLQDKIKIRQKNLYKGISFDNDRRADFFKTFYRSLTIKISEIIYVKAFGIFLFNVYNAYELSADANTRLKFTSEIYIYTILKNGRKCCEKKLFKYMNNSFFRW